MADRLSVGINPFFNLPSSDEIGPLTGGVRADGTELSSFQGSTAGAALLTLGIITTACGPAPEATLSPAIQFVATRETSQGNTVIPLSIVNFDGTSDRTVTFEDLSIPLDNAPSLNWAFHRQEQGGWFLTMDHGDDLTFDVPGQWMVPQGTNFDKITSLYFVVPASSNSGQTHDLVTAQNGWGPIPAISVYFNRPQRAGQLDPGAIEEMIFIDDYHGDVQAVSLTFSGASAANRVIRDTTPLPVGGGELGFLPTQPPTTRSPEPTIVIPPTMTSASTAPPATATTESTKTPEPTPVAGYEQRGENWVYTTESGEQINITVPEGYEIRQEEGKLQLYHEGNYAAEFSPNVKMGGELTGSWVASSSFALEYLNEQLAQIPEQKDRWLITIPIDPRTVPNVNMYIEDYSGLSSYRLVVDFQGSTSLVNIIPNTSSIRIIYSTQMQRWMCVDPLTANDQNYLNRIVPGEEMRYLSVRGFLIDVAAENQTKLNVPFGTTIAQTSGPVLITEECATEYRAISWDHVLDLAGVPLFIAP